MENYADMGRAVKPWLGKRSMLVASNRIATISPTLPDLLAEFSDNMPLPVGPGYTGVPGEMFLHSRPARYLGTADTISFRPLWVSMFLSPPPLSCFLLLCHLRLLSSTPHYGDNMDEQNNYFASLRQDKEM